MGEQLALGLYEAYGLMAIVGVSGWGVAYIIWKRYLTVQDKLIAAIEQMTKVATVSTEALDHSSEVTKLNTDALREISAESKASRRLMTTQARRG